MELKEWLNAMPNYFPASFSERPPNHNPLVGNMQNETISSVHDVLQFVQFTVANCERNKLHLTFNETWGIWHIISTCSGALHFEAECRPDGGDPVEVVGEETEQEAELETEPETGYLSALLNGVAHLRLC